MRRLIFGPGQDKSREALERFLSECRDEAAAAGDWRLVSISLRVGPVDPLAVLEAIFEPEESHFYLEKATDGRAVAGAEAVVGFSFSGPERFAKAQDFVSKTLERTICFEDPGEVVYGPRFFFDFSFLDDPGSESSFSGASGFVPRWQVTREGELCVATANMRVDETADPRALAERVWRAHKRFSGFPGYPETAEGAATDRHFPKLLEQKEAVTRAEFEHGVQTILGKIDDGNVWKVVLARPIDLRFEEKLRPLPALTRMRSGYSNCFTFSIGNGRGAHFIGASPELLARRRGERLETEALAGSAPRGATREADRKLAEELLASNKDLREHRLVVEAILRRLGGFSVEMEPPNDPRVVQLANVQHLHTALQGKVTGELRLLDVLAALHPTPAVGGTPRAAASDMIRQLEKFPRGLYAGAVGWMDARGDGEFTVPIRSVQIDGEAARLFVGAGIVAGSEPAREWEETEVKSRPVLDALIDRANARKR